MIETQSRIIYCNFQLMNANITFPVYRKYKNNQSFFKISSLTVFEEIKLSGKSGQLYVFTAKILPDRNFILDMLYDYDKYWMNSNEQEYNEVKEKYIHP